jgi:3-oxoacyl-[acyl-carrier protein] reductase
MSSGTADTEENRPAGLLAGRRVLVTGGSGGIGQGIATVCAREGARVGFTYCGNADNAGKTLALVRAHGEGMAIQADLRDRAAAARVVAEIEAAWGGVDVLVNNAGASEVVPFILLEDDEWDDLIELNVSAAFRLCRAAARGMLRQKYGRIVNIGSVAGSRAIPSPVHYATSKAALEGMTRSLAHELGQYGILVNCIAAGIFEGGLRSTIPEHHQQRYVASCALHRIGQPAECGELVAWMASARNTYLNGAVVVLDGGTLA